MGDLGFIWAMFAGKVLVTAPPAEEVLEGTSHSQFLDQGRNSGREQSVDESGELLLTLVDCCLIGAKEGGLLAKFWDVVMDIE